MKTTMDYANCRTTIVLLMVSALVIIIMVVLHPSSINFHVTEAFLTQFHLTSNNTLYYNFKVHITGRNPNNNAIVYYRRITAIAWYKDREFGRVSLAPFDQGHKNTSFLQPAVFEGQSVIDLKPRHVDEYNMETRAGVYNDLAVDLDVLIRTKYGGIKSRRYHPPIVQCRLRVPLISNGKSAASFNVTKCSNGDFFPYRRYF